MEMGLHSLIRRLRLPDSGARNYVQVRSEKSKYEIIDSEKSLKVLMDRLLETEICAIDTEASSKDSHSAILFGIAFSNGAWNCYVPILEQDLRRISARLVLSEIKGVLEYETRKYIGHNIKYDYVLLRRHGIHLKSLCFDTMLAAFECYGDLEFLNLGFLSEKLLGRGKSPYREMLGKTDSPWDIPRAKLAEHACEDAEVTFHLFRSLQKEITSKGLGSQFVDETLPLCRLLGDFEYHGIEVDETKLDQYCDNLDEKAQKLRQDVNMAAGREVNIDADDEVQDLLSSIVDSPPGNKPYRTFIAFLEILAISHNIPRLIVQYKRLTRHIHEVQNILRSIRNGRIYPVFSQVRSKPGFVSSMQPDIFGLSTSRAFQSCFESKVYPFFKDAVSATERLADLSSDHVLRTDMSNDCSVNGFISGHPSAQGKDSVGLLLSFVAGVSDDKIMHQVLIDRPNLAVLRRDIESRYEKLFSFLDNFKRTSLEKGFSEIEGKRKYLAGLRSPDIEKRRKAVEYAVAWLIGYSNY